MSEPDFAGGTLQFSDDLCHEGKVTRFAALQEAAMSWKVIHVGENRLVSNRRCRRLSEENKTIK